MESDRLNEELRHLKERLDRGEIAQADYEKECQRLLGSAGHARPVDPFAAPEGDNYHPRRPTRLADLAPGMEIGPEDNRFRLVREIGGGAMGRVWLAHDLAEEELEGGERFKALKVVNPLLQDSPRALEMLKREAMQASKLSHPNIINVYGWRQGRDGWLFVVMGYLEGRDLDRLLLDEGKPGLSWEQTFELLEPIAAGLDYAHAQHVIHSDLKPGNVFITKEGEVKLLDFGLAYRLHRSSSMVKVQESSSSGTPEYMPPEAFAAGVPGKAQDIYALACIAYEMLTGEPSYIAEAAVERSPDLVPSKPEGLTEAAWEVLKSGLVYRKEERPKSAGELVQCLEAAQAVTKPEEIHPKPFSKPDLPPVQDIHGWSAEKVRILQQRTAEALGKPVEFQDSLKDGSSGPDMVVIPPGEFLMGSPEDEEGRDSDERQHRVKIEQPFAMGKYEITFAEYDRFAEATERDKPNDQGWGRGKRPVIYVNSVVPSLPLRRVRLGWKNTSAFP